jgi:hypothetical protein
MENDSIRSSGSDTLVDIWIDGKVRAISVSHEAIGGVVGFDRMVQMTDQDRCEFVRKNLSLILAAAKDNLRDGNPLADAVAIDVGQLASGSGKGADRRRTERRTKDRRNTAKPLAGQTERRRGDRRKGERRTRPPKRTES